MLNKKKEFSSMQEELEENRKLVEILRKKHKEAEGERKDILIENENNKQDLLDMVRDQERELGFLNEVLAIVFKE